MPIVRALRCGSAVVPTCCSRVAIVRLDISDLMSHFPVDNDGAVREVRGRIPAKFSRGHELRNTVIPIVKLEPQVFRPHSYARNSPIPIITRIHHRG